MKVWHQCWQIRQPALLCKLRSSAQGLLRLLSATAAKSISEVKPSNKRGAHQLGVAARQLEDDGTEGEGTHHEWIVEVRYNADS